MVINNFSLICLIFLVYLISFFFIKNRKYRGVMGIIVGAFIILLTLFVFYMHFIQGTFPILSVQEIILIFFAILWSFTGIFEGIKMVTTK
jgi:hypothetical protein